MTAKTFVDSNILIYAHDEATACRGSSGNALDLRYRTSEHTGTAGILLNVTRKTAAPLGAETVVRATEIAEVWHVSFWDAMIVAAAEQSGAEQLLTEDLTPGQKIAGISIVNPFLSAGDNRPG